MSTATTIIAGAGPSGLTAGHPVAGDGQQPLLLEQRGRVGLFDGLLAGFIASWLYRQVSRLRRGQ